MRYAEIINNKSLSIEEIACIMLKRSCESVRKRCNEKRGKYKDVRCNLTPSPLRKALMGVTAFWDDWVKLTRGWINKGYEDRYRPTLDRIIKNGHYEIDNIQALPQWENTMKATSKKCMVVNYNDNYQVECQLIWGQEKTLKKLGLSMKELTDGHRNQLDKVDLLFFNYIPAEIGGISITDLVVDL
ncbi:hypothetical protein [Neobacillus drentensis]|uniref:hypothetical protein n=1 Tax=Neobacillus drentensis TaxID=220684 RepID=UPI002FFFA75D